MEEVGRSEDSLNESMNGYSPSTGDREGGAVNRQIRVFLRTSGDDGMHDGHSASPLLGPYPAYKPSVTLLDLNKHLRRFGLPISRSYCTQLWFVKDCGGYFGAGFTWMFIFVGELLVLLVLLMKALSLFVVFNGILSFGCAFLGFVAHCRAMFTDPGAVPRGDATNENIARMAVTDGQVIYKCQKCDCIKPERAHHCSTCRRCIRKMDHHCPWINNCVGENNQKYFVLFTMYICFISWHALFLAIYHLISCALTNFDGCSYSPGPSIVVTVGLTVEGLMFGIFTAIMCGSQLSAICSDETGIEHLKKETGKWEKRSCWTNMRLVFGNKFTYRWFSPFHATEDLCASNQSVYSYL